MHERDLEMELATTQRIERRSSHTADCAQYLGAEVRRCLSDIITQIVKDDAKANRHARLERRTAHNQLIKATVESQRDSGALRYDICWEFARTNGKCTRLSSGKQCPFKHELVPLSALPASEWNLVCEDSFPQAREGDDHKEHANAILREMSASVSNPRCLVLDGGECHTVRELLSCTVHNRQACDIYVPNNVSCTFVKIRDLNICTPFHGSVRAFLDCQRHNNRSKNSTCTEGPVISTSFGLIYLDYCCSLDSGKRNVEKSPTHDMHAMFESGACDPSECVLAICLSSSIGERTEQEPEGQRAISQAVCGIAAQYGYQAEYDESHSFDYGYMRGSSQHLNNELMESSRQDAAMHDAGLMHFCVFHVHRNCSQR